MNIKIILAAGAMVALAGCAGNGLSQAEKVTAQGTEFSKALSTGYLRLARAEQAEFDYADADYFAARAITSANADSVPLPEVTARDLPQEEQIYVLGLRNELVEVFDAGARARTPQLAAAAQIAYECWIQELEENRQQDEIAACRDQLDGLIPALRAAAPEAAAMAPKPKAKPTKGKLFRVFFPTGGTKLNDEANKTISAAAAHTGNYKAVRVVVSGYTDTVGDAAANEALSAKRARVVAAAMRIRGIAAAAIKSRGYGELFPDVKTADGVAEQKNRRVEINVGGR
ncbi:MAG: OOP family OmpA-OmpF porin [Alphaproteobacteria bacterium]|jgi:OOP family OmpA-OmpF porin